MTREPKRLTRMAHVEGGSKEWGLLGVYIQSSTWAQRLQQATRERLEPGSYVGLDSVSSAGFATTVSLGGRGSCGLPVFTEALMMAGAGAGLERGLEPSAPGLS